MTRLLIAFILLSLPATLHARSIAGALPRTDTTALRHNGSGLKRAAPGSALHYACGKKAAPGYDVSRENGAYFFDTVYRLRVPVTKRLLVSVNGGYTYYDRYVHGFGKAGSLGVTGGVSLMINPFVGHRQQGIKKGFLRLNAELSSYPYRKGVPGDGPKTTMLEKYSRELSSRIYLDARLSRRLGKGAIITRCMIGISAGAEQLSAATSLFVGAGIAYRFL